MNMWDQSSMSKSSMPLSSSSAPTTSATFGTPPNLVSLAAAAWKIACKPHRCHVISPHSHTLGVP